MCGIAAICGPQKNLQRLEDMLRTIAHRGESQYFNESAEFTTCVIGMNRLAIIDRDHARQPVSSADGRYYGILNGEIYNYQDLRRELQGLGLVFKTESDTEVLVNAYAAWGAACLDKLSGMYAFAIYDRKGEALFAARDPFGVKPLYFLKSTGGSLYLASEIKALCRIGEQEEIKLFPPGHYMSDGQLIRYFNLPNSVNAKAEEKIAIENIRRLFDNALKSRVQTDLPVAVYFSGGIDSASVLEAAVRFHPDVTAIIVGSDASQDRQVATRYCEENNIKYVIGVPPDEDELFELVPRIVQITESFEPNMIRQAAVAYHIAKTAADHGFKVILCGEGSDEIFAGYPEFSELGSTEVEKRILEFLSDLHRTQLQRVDRISMSFTTEVREPFLDKAFVSYVLTLPGYMKVDPKTGVVKAILRKAMADRLPEYISQRKKVVLSEGAGLKGNDKKAGLFYDLAAKKISDASFKEMKAQYKEWNLETKEDAYYFSLFKSHGYNRALFNTVRTSVNKSATLGIDESSVQKVLGAFNTWSFKRCQPRHIDKMRDMVLSCIQDNKPLSFVMYWGKGERDSPNERESDALKYLNDMLSKIRTEHAAGATAALILTDTHAQLNGHETANVNRYFLEMEKLASQYQGIQTIYFTTFCKLEEKLLIAKANTHPLSKEVMNRLQPSALRHSKKYPPEQGAALYYWQNQIEKEKVSSVFKNHIFVTYNGNDVDFLFPDDMPIFYMYSMARGRGEKPWHF